jgi:hypothetical protein
VLPPPWPAFVAAGVAAALGVTALRVTGWIGSRTWAHFAVALATVLATVGAAIHALAWLGLVRLVPMQIAGLALAVAGWAWIVRAALRERTWLELAKSWLRGASWWDRVVGAAAAATVLALASCALAPATDADSLAYHLALGVEALNIGGSPARSDWLQFRLAGLGDYVSVLGLAAGTDALSAALQLIALVCAAGMLYERASDATGRWLAVLLVVGTPVMLFLVPNQKPQLLPAVAIVAVGLLAADGPPGGRTAAACGAAIGFALASKASFILSGGIAGSMLLFSMRRSAYAGRALAAAVSCGVVVALPLFAHNLAVFGDPISPFLERFRAHPDPQLVAFAKYLRVAGGVTGLREALFFPIWAVIPPSPGAYSTALGLGVLSVIPAIAGRRGHGVLLAGAAGAAGATVLLGQFAARFFLEPYLWVGAVAVAAAGTVGRDLLRRALGGQAMLTCASALVGALSLAPGAFTSTARAQVLARAAHNYADMRWLDDVLPRDSTVLLHGIRSVSMSPRPYVGGDLLQRPGAASELALRIRSGRVTAIASTDPKADPLVSVLTTSCGEPLAPPFLSRQATRNPFNAGPQYSVFAFRLRPGDACDAALEALGASASR